MRNIIKIIRDPGSFGKSKPDKSANGRGWLNYNGNFVREKTPVVRADNRALRYGDGLFETMKVVVDQIHLADLHAQRLFGGMQALQFSVPSLPGQAILEEQVRLTVARNKIKGPARVRLMVFRGNGGLYDFSTSGAGYVIQAWPLSSSVLSFNPRGLDIGLAEGGLKAADAYAHLKSNQFMVYAMAALHARARGWDDALVLNTWGRVCDSTIANLFWVREGKVFTPPLSEGCIAGVMRAHLLQRMREEGVPVEEKPAEISDLQEAQEIFLTNAIQGLRSVRSFGQKLYGQEMAARLFPLTV